MIVSRALKLPHVKKTATQIVVKTRFRQSEFGMMAGLPNRSWRPTHQMKAGMRRMASVRSTILEGWRIEERLPAIVAKTYESIASEVLAMMAPIQSISVFMRCHLCFQVGGPSSSV
jgi:hypothetical protein